jgi:CAAX protease family protein
VRRCAARSVLVACAVAAALAAASDLLSWAIGRPLVPPFVAETYATALSVPLMVLATVIAAPLMEELFFRGFLLSALGVRGVSPLVSGVLVSFVWAAIHAQYDLYGIGTIFVTGLILSAVRFRYDSIVPTIAMHALVNTVAFVEAAIAARLSG